jgi:hypothetical protein
MIITGKYRTRSGDKKPIRIAGYREAGDLQSAFDTVKFQIPYATVILFLIPKETKL